MRINTRHRAKLFLYVALLSTAAAAAGLAQSQSGSPAEALAPLRQGPLIVWFVGDAERTPESNLQAIAALHHATPLEYHEQTSGSFGQNASSYGQNSGSYGVDSNSATISTPQPAQGEDAPAAAPNGIGYRQQESGSFGQNAGSYGTEGSNYGTESSRLGQTSGSFGTSASNHGQDVGSFGNSNSTIAQAGNETPPTAKPSRGAAQFQQKLKQAFPELQAKVTDVAPQELNARLRAAQGTVGYPDVLVGTLPPAWSNGMQRTFGLAMLRPASFYPDGVTQSESHAEGFALLARAPHMQAARAFALWMSEQHADCPGCVQAGLSSSERAAAAVATSAVGRLLRGSSLGAEADPAMAGSVAQGVRSLLATTGGGTAEGASLHVEVERATTNGSLAAVALRVVVSSNNVFGVAHPLVVLRATKDGHWRVLQVSLHLPQTEQETLRQTLMVTSPASIAEQRAGVKGVAQAAPREGATSTPCPELVWDNGGGAGLQVVEWQSSSDGRWSDARLFLVEDRNPRLQTHVAAQFAGAAGRYRWRVWSVGAHGDMRISPWRTFSVVL